MKDVRCIGCGQKPDDIQEYIDAANENGLTPDSYVEQEEGTYNPKNGHFLCTSCFIETEIRTGRRLVGVNGQTWTAP